MGLFLTISIIGILVCAVVVVDNAINTPFLDIFEKITGAIFELIVAAIVVCLAALIISMLSTCIATNIADKYFIKEEITYDIYNLNDSSAIEGRTTHIVFCQTATINTEMKYRFMRWLDGGYVMCEVDVNDARLNYVSGGETPYVKVINEHIKDSFWTWNLESDYKYYIYIPRGTISSDYTVDLQ